MSKVLIAGGTGLVGRRLQEALLKRGYEVFILSRKKSNLENTFFWDVDLMEIDTDVIKSVDYVVNLSGAPIADKRWTSKRKDQIISSRTNSTRLLVDSILKFNPNLKGYISASAVGYYGGKSSLKVFEENDEYGDDFLGRCCLKWEEASSSLIDVKVRRIVFRIGTVLSVNGGMLSKLITPFKFGLGAVLSDGKQSFSWIHIDDLCEAFVRAIEKDEMDGVYNLVASYCSNKEFSKTLSKVLNRPLIITFFPKSIIKLCFGELSVLLTDGKKVSNKKITSGGFVFKHPNLEAALHDLIH